MRVQFRRLNTVDILINICYCFGCSMFILVGLPTLSQRARKPVLVGCYYRYLKANVTYRREYMCGLDCGSGLSSGSSPM